MQYLKYIVITILTLEARLVLWRFKPKIIAVVGSVGKTSTKDAIYTALRGTFYIRKNQKSLNSEIGTPLTILGLESGWNDPVLWLKNIIVGALQVFRFKYPEWLILEVGADQPGDIRTLSKWLRPTIVVVTSMPDVPVHVEAFESPEALIEEDLSIISHMRSGGMLIINADESRTKRVIEAYKVPVMTYGSVAQADVSFEHHTIIYDELDGISKPTGVSCKIAYSGSAVPISLHGVLGVTHIYPVVAALAVGLSQGVPFLTMTQALVQHEPPRGRMHLIAGKNGSTIIDDSYNASPVAVARALETLAAVTTSSNKIAVLGDMLEIGSYTAAEHKKVGAYVAELGITHLIAVGIRAEYISKAAIEAGMNESHVQYVRTSEQAAESALMLLKTGTVMLVKGSQSMRTEKVVAACMANPEQQHNLLIRQERAWQNR
jgi:UDP-N-acetylmuramoyl-tripeptide--D-alanyl-D-alanine ligase